MECNRDEAVRAKAIAERKLGQKDFVGAKKFALKAQTLFPGLDGILQLLTTVDVYVSAENKIAGEVDWYGVLNVNPTADEEAIKKQYRKLALMLHPDKNSSAGADGAFKLISEAHTLLGNKEKRSAYNQRRGFRVSQPYTPTYTGNPSPYAGAASAYAGVPSAHNTVPSARPNFPSSHASVPSTRPTVPSSSASVPSARPSVASTYNTGPSAHSSASSVPPGTNTFSNFAGKTPPIPKAPKKASKTPKATSTPNDPPRTDTFWTMCHQCNMQYEYLKIYRNYTLLCPNCKKPFMASETAAPAPGSKPKPPKASFFQQQQSSNVKLPTQNANEPVRNASVAHKSAAGQAGPSSGTTGTNSRDPVFGQVQSNMKRSSSGPPSHVLGGNSAPAADLEVTNKKRKIDGNSSGLGSNSKMAQGDGGSRTASGCESKVQGGFGTGSAFVSDVHGSYGTANAFGSNVQGSFGTASVSSSKVPGGFGTVNASGLRVPGGFGTSSASGSSVPRGFGTANASGSKAYGVFKTTSTSGLRGPGGFGAANAPGSRIHVVSGSYPSTTRGHVFSGAYYQPKPNNIRELTPKEARTMMITKAKSFIQNKLSAWRSETHVKAADLSNGKSKEPSKETHNYSSKGHDKINRGSESSAKKTADHVENSMASHSADYEVKENPEADLPSPMTVPDPDFHDFDKDRTEIAFSDNEVWACYDDDDGMPRFYALISKVVSRDPFKLRISWLNSKTNTEFSTADWIGSGFYKTCGEFRIGKYEVCRAVNAFSQKVNNWSKGPRGSIIILPQKGDVWALYRNWSSDWNELTPDEVIHKYDMVVVLDDYSEENGVSVAPLVKVVGFKTVFCQNSDSDAIKRIPREEMFRFSHLVPHHLLTRKEAPNTPNGCLELDPAATPLELLQVLTETNGVSGNGNPL